MTTFGWGHTAAHSARQYGPLVQNLVARELKKKYRRSLLGYLWCVLNPLLVLLILNVVFSNMFRSSIENYPVYLFAGRMVFSFITDATQNVERSIRMNGSLIRKTRIPYLVFPVANFCSSVVNFAFSVIAFCIVLIATQTAITVHAVFLPVVLLQLFAFSFGAGLMLAQASVKVRDVDYLYAVFITAWMYLTPIFYPLTSLPDQLQAVITGFNPAYFYVQQMRDIFVLHQWPAADLVIRGAVVGILFLWAGLWIFRRREDSFILYV